MRALSLPLSPFRSLSLSLFLSPCVSLSVSFSLLPSLSLPLSPPCACVCADTSARVHVHTVETSLVCCCTTGHRFPFRPRNGSPQISVRQKYISTGLCLHFESNFLSMNQGTFYPRVLSRNFLSMNSRNWLLSSFTSIILCGARFTCKVVWTMRRFE